MADTKITALTALTAADPANDVLPIVDVSDTTMAASGTTKKISVNNILGASGTATLASATITGNLTVNGSYISCGNNSYIRTDAANLFSIQTGSGGFRIMNAGNSALFYGIDSASTSTWYDGAGGTRMTLNSTGLGVGVSPSALLHVQKSQNSETTAIINNTNTGTSAGVRLDLQSNSSNYLTLQSFGQNYSGNAFGIAAAKLNVVSENSATAFSSGLAIGTTSSNPLYFATSNAVKMTLDASGNVGIGVTPSAWRTSVPFKALQIGYTGAVYALGATEQVNLSSNYLQDTAGNEVRIQAGYATRYQQSSGSHIWSTAGTSTAGSGITFSQAMTLDASGNLLVGKTATNLQVVGCELKADGTVFSTLVDTTNAAASSYQLYSTGAATYRFYVGMGGTVFATNTTISGISDARLKENVQDIDVGLGAILALKPRKFDWKAGKGKDIKGDRGFIAQEFETVFPNLIDEWKDAAPEGEAPYKSVRQDLIPVLVKAIQELAARVQTLETR